MYQQGAGEIEQGAGEINEWLSAEDALPEDQGSILSTHIVVHNCL